MQTITSNKRKCLWVDMPLTEYTEALELQHRIVDAKVDRSLSDDVVLALEHPGVYTLGRRGGRENLTVPESFLADQGIRIVQIERGGNITYHGPGQLVVYPIINIRDAGIGVADFVGIMEAAMVCTAARWGIDANGDEKNRGAWIGSRKLGSIGITVRRGISFHGLALNVSLSLKPFGWINPCGLSHISMTSMEKELSENIPMEEAGNEMKKQLSRLLDVDPIQCSLSSLKKMII